VTSRFSQPAHLSTVRSTVPAQAANASYNQPSTKDGFELKAAARTLLCHSLILPTYRLTSFVLRTWPFRNNASAACRNHSTPESGEFPNSHHEFTMKSYGVHTLCIRPLIRKYSGSVVTWIQGKYRSCLLILLVFSGLFKPDNSKKWWSNYRVRSSIGGSTLF
jgi:hypothetical protein